jgi:predicted acylesterase/phospholipase RssA
MTVQHIVITGGGPTGFVSYGVIKRLHEEKIWSHENIKSIYGSSIGGLIAVIVSLGIDWETLDDYIIKRPWGKTFVNISCVDFDIIGLFANKGIDGKQMISIILEPLLKLIDLPLDVTLKCFSEKTGIDLHLIATDLNGSSTLVEVDICADKTPDIKLCDAVAASLAIPILFQPIIYKTSCLLDGGILHNYPLNICLKNIDDENSVIGIRNEWHTENLCISSESSYFEFLRIFLRKLHNSVDSTTKQPIIKNEIICDVEGLSNIEKWIESIDSAELRSNLINDGINIADNFISTKFIETNQETA